MSTSSTTSILSDVIEEELILRGGVVEVQFNHKETSDTFTKINITHRFIGFTQKAGSMVVRIYYSAVTDFSLDTEGFAQPRIVINYDVNKEDGCTNKELRECAIDYRKSLETAEDESVIPVDESGNPDYDNYKDPCPASISFYPEDPEECSLEALYNALSEGMSIYKETAEKDNDKGDDEGDDKGDKDDDKEDKDDKDDDKEDDKGDDKEDDKDDDKEDDRDDDKEDDKDDDKEDDKDDDKEDDKDDD